MKSLIVFCLALLFCNMSCKTADVVKRLGFDSVTSYVWIHHVSLPKMQTDYEYVQEEYFMYWTKAQSLFDVPYHPNEGVTD